VSTATSGIEALKCAAELKPDLILLDVMMPSMDGPTTLRALRQNRDFKNTPIVFMTARIREKEVDDYLNNVGADGVIAKPFNPMTLHELLNTQWKKIHHIP